MIPFERDIYLEMLKNYLTELEEKQKANAQ